VADVGVQLAGVVAKVNIPGVPEGYSQAMDDIDTGSQVQRRLYIDVEKILNFGLAQHTDDENI
jgi:hypothetical protein